LFWDVTHAKTKTKQNQNKTKTKQNKTKKGFGVTMHNLFYEIDGFRTFPETIATLIESSLGLYTQQNKTSQNKTSQNKTSQHNFKNNTKPHNTTF